jgi:drug/metabolite transporter (DMT)-like permease
MILKILLLILIFGLTSSFSIMLTGNRALLSREINIRSIINLLLDWRFIISMLLAVVTRFVFIWINHSLLKLPDLAKNSTTITALITATSYMFIILVNYVFLKERISGVQFAGVILIIGGIILVTK